MNSVFKFEWLDDIEDLFTSATTGEPAVVLRALDYPIRFGTSAYTGYIVTIQDLDTEEIISFNCDRIDLNKAVIEKTYHAMNERFAIKSNGVPFTRKNVKILSVTVPQEVYVRVLTQFQVNNSLLWRIWTIAKDKKILSI